MVRKSIFETFDDFTCWVMSQRSQIPNLKMIHCNFLNKAKSPKNGVCAYKKGLRPEIKILIERSGLWSLRGPTCQFSSSHDLKPRRLRGTNEQTDRQSKIDSRYYLIYFSNICNWEQNESWYLGLITVQCYFFTPVLPFTQLIG